MRQKRVPLGRKSFPKRGCLVGYGRNPKMVLSQCCIDFDTKTYRFGHISGPSYKEAQAGWPAGWLVGWLAGWLAGWQARKTPNVIVSQKCINFITKTHRFEHISCPSYRLAGQLAGWLAGRLPAMRLGHQNASKTRTLSTKVRRKCVPSSRKSTSN